MLRRVGHWSFYVVDLYDRCVTGLLDITAKDVSVIDETVQTYKMNTLVGTCVSLTIKKSQRTGYTNYNVIRLDVLH